MAFSSCLCNPQVSFKIDYPGRPLASCRWSVGRDEKLCVSIKSSSTNLFGQRVATAPDSKQCNWSFLGGSRLIVRIKVARFFINQKSSPVYASWITNSQLASSAFTLGTAAVLPFYFLMVLAPKSQLNMIYKLGGLPNLDFPSTLPLVKTCISLNFQALTIKSMESSIPYVVLGLLYAYLLYLSWTPDTLRMIFASKYWLPELPGIAKMFSSDMTLSSAWIHLLAVDLFAARQVFHDGLENEVETRHSVSLCLFFCPIGIVTHFITKALTKKA